MSREKRFRWILSAVSRYITFFLVIAFVISCCTMLFVTILSNTLELELTRETISGAAKITFLNVVFISLLLTVIDTIRRKLTVERPVRRITEAAEKMIKGDFSVRIKPVSRFVTDEGFNEIIDDINKMATELSSVEALSSDIIANVSHEMKTPLTIIQNYGTLLQSPDLPEEKRMEYAKAITDASRRLSDMMTNILKLNRLENQQIFPTQKRYDLGEQLCECLLQYETTWESKNIEIETDIEEGVMISADGELLSLVWNNLFSNAFKFTPEGGKVFILLAADEKYATVKVTDTGCGMTPEVGARIFEKFYQGDTSRATQGNGLGLALVKRVVDIVQGEITVDSTVGVGSTFSIKIRRGSYDLEENR